MSEISNIPAFPCPASYDQGVEKNPAQVGMSLRDWFAGMALCGKIDKVTAVAFGDRESKSFDLVALAYIMADQAMKERELA